MSGGTILIIIIAVFAITAYVFIEKRVIGESRAKKVVGNIVPFIITGLVIWIILFAPQYETFHNVKYQVDHGAKTYDTSEFDKEHGFPENKTYELLYGEYLRIAYRGDAKDVSAKELYEKVLNSDLDITDYGDWSNNGLSGYRIYYTDRTDAEDNGYITYNARIYFTYKGGVYIASWDDQVYTENQADYPFTNIMGDSPIADKFFKSIRGK